MTVKLIVRVHPDDRVEVKVEGLTARDQAQPPEKKLCKKVTERLVRDLGDVTQCVYSGGDDSSEMEITNPDQIELGG
jgi:hypothetical protein